MKVLMQCRKNFYTLQGGDTIQLLKTKSELEKLGVIVDISLEYEPDLSNYDIVHLSNLTRIQETYIQTINAVSQKKPIVLSTIFWPMDEFEKKGQIGIRKFINSCIDIDTEEKIKALARYIKDKNSRDKSTKNIWKIGYSNMQKYVLRHVDYYLPNSQMEMDALCKHFSFKTGQYIVVPNAIDANIAKKQLEAPDDLSYSKYKDAIICVGRIEPRKNQLALVKALKNTKYELVLVGTVSNNQKKYFAEISKYIKQNPRFTYISQIGNEELYKLYKVCKVSVLPSWLDTPGLVSLEAAAMGCNLAVSEKGSTREYFGDLAEYCLPDDLDGIRMAVDKAYSKEKDNKLQNKVFKNYTWEIAAKKTLKAYRYVLDSKKEN